MFGACTHAYYMILSDFAAGGQLDKYLKKGDNYSRVWELLHDAARGLQWLHFRGVIHGDLEGNNIVVGDDGRAKLIDFGLSRIELYRGLTCSAAVHWAAPECLRGERLTPASDVYSFGMCVVEAVSGRVPWWGTDPAVIQLRVKDAKLPSKPNQFTLAQWGLIRRMCHPQPEARLTMEEVVKLLGLFANRPPLNDDEKLRDNIAKWEQDEAKMRWQHAKEEAKALCDAASERKFLCLHVCERLQQVQTVVAERKPPVDGSWCRAISDVVERCIAFLRKRGERSFVKRLAINHKAEEEIRSFHEAIDQLKQTAGLAPSATDWRVQWTTDRRATLQMFCDFAHSKPQSLEAEKINTSFVEAQSMLRFEVQYRRHQYEEDEDEIATAYLQLMQHTLDCLYGATDAAQSGPSELLAIPEWFIPRDDVDFDSDASFDCGSYGSVHRGTWTKGATGGGSGAKVVVKCLLVDDAEAKRSFYKEVDVLSTSVIIDGCARGWS